MTKRLSSMRRRLIKATNVAALVSMLASLFTFAPMLPVHAEEALETLTTTLAQPIFSADWVTDPSYTNVTYTWEQTRAFQAGATDSCIGDVGATSCVRLEIDLQDVGDPADHLMQAWHSQTLDVTDFSLSPTPANVSIDSVTSSDVGVNGRDEHLVVVLKCTAACAFTTSTAYTLTILNQPIKNMVAPTPYVEGVYSTTSHYFTAFDQTDPNQQDETLATIVAVGKGVTVTASVDPTLSFYIQGLESGSFFTDVGDGDINIDNSAVSDSCDFGTLTPGIAKVCTWLMNIATNANNGYSIYVVQDQNMTFNGNTIKQYDSAMVVDDDRLDDSAATIWQPPESAALAHLGYSSDDTSVFVNAAPAEWAGIPTIATAGQAPIVTGLVADSANPGDDIYNYAIKIESASTLPQGTGYTHNEYFIVVGNF